MFYLQKVRQCERFRNEEICRSGVCFYLFCLRSVGMAKVTELFPSSRQEVDVFVYLCKMLSVKIIF